MRRLAAVLLALPWTIYVSTGEYENGGSVTHYYARHETPGHPATGVHCGEDTDSCQDFVDSMNKAHFSREGRAEVVAPAPKKSKKLKKLILTPERPQQ